MERLFCQVGYLRQGGLSVRKACVLLSVTRSTLRYESRPVKCDAPVVAVMHELAAQYPRYGYGRIQVFLARRGHVMSADRTHRLWRLHGLQVPRKRARRRVAATRPRPLAPTEANQKAGRSGWGPNGDLHENAVMAAHIRLLWLLIFAWSFQRA